MSEYLNNLINYGQPSNPSGNLSGIANIGRSLNLNSDIGGGGTSNPGFMDGMTGYTQADGNQVNGWGGLALGTMQGLASGYLGLKQYGLAKDQLNESKRQFQLNFDNQKKLTNAELEDRQTARVASNPNAYRSVSEYMGNNGV